MKGGRGRNQKGSLFPRGGCWIGRFVVASGSERKRVSYSLGRLDEVTQAQAQAKLRDTIKKTIGEKRAVESLSGVSVVFRTVPRSGQDNGLLGAQSELLACVDLMNKGWTVYRAIDAYAACDLVAIKNDQFLRVEVKTEGPQLKLKAKRGKFDVLAVVGKAGGVRYFSYHALPEFGTVRMNKLGKILEEVAQDERILITNLDTAPGLAEGSL